MVQKEKVSPEQAVFSCRTEIPSTLFGKAFSKRHGKEKLISQNWQLGLYHSVLNALSWKANSAHNSRLL